MFATDSAPVIVARFLKANHYNETLAEFLKEAALPEDAASTNPGDWTIEKILEEKKQFDQSLAYEKTGDDRNQEWTQPSPSVAHEPQVDVSSNVLCVSGNHEENTIAITTADRTWKQVSGMSPYQTIESLTSLSDSPILSVKAVSGGFTFSTSMSGKLMLRRATNAMLIDECRHHAKYAVQSTMSLLHDVGIVATAGWDQKLYFYAIDYTKLNSHDFSTDESVSTNVALPGILGDPFHCQSLQTNPESLVFVRHPDTGNLYLVVTRRDSTFLYYYRVDINTEDNSAPSYRVVEAGRQNLAPHSNAWVGFTPCSLALCPTDSTLLAIATSHLPHLRVIIVRLLFPDTAPQQILQPETQAAMARADLALQDREDAAILLHVTTMAPQTPYSTPQVVWRPNGSGLFVNGDDGVVRGVEAKTGKVVSLLKGHEVGTKVRTLWAGVLKDKDERDIETLISGGFDKKVLIWTAQE